MTEPHSTLRGIQDLSIVAAVTAERQRIIDMIVELNMTVCMGGGVVSGRSVLCRLYDTLRKDMPA